MKALILGGTSGLGEHVTSSLEKLGFDTLTVSRKKLDRDSHYSCDLGDTNSCIDAFSKIREDHPSLDAIFCIAGYAVPTRLEDQTSDFYDNHIIRNFGYVALAFDFFKESLMTAERPIFATIGSRWSLKTECKELLPYIAAKHTLRLFCEQKVKTDPWLKTFNYCVPTMHTPRYQYVQDKLVEINPETRQKMFGNSLAMPEVVASSLTAHSLGLENNSGIYTVSPDGKICILE